MPTASTSIEGDYSLILKGEQALTPNYGTPRSLTRNIFYDAEGRPTVHLAVRIDSLTDINSVRVDETLPSGVTVASVNNGGSWDSLNNRVSWIFTPPAKGTYLLSYAPSGPRGQHSPVGQLVINLPSEVVSTYAIGDDSFYIYELDPAVVGGTLTATRSIDDQLVTIAAVPASTTAGYVISENVPAGLTPVNIGDGGAWNSTTRKITWTFPDKAVRQVSYAVTGSDGSYEIAGSTVTFDLTAIPIEGESTIAIGIVGSGEGPAVRSLNGLQINVAVNPPTGTASYRVIEYIPNGLTISEISDGGTYSEVYKRITWEFNDGTVRTLKYTVAGSDGVYALSGVYQFGTSYGLVTGSPYITIGDGLLSSTIARSVVGTVVFLSIVPVATVTAYSFEETLPEGLTPTGISNNGYWDVNSRKIKWGPFSGSASGYAQYAVIGSPGTYALTGVGTFDSASIVPTGATSVVIQDPAADLPVVGPVQPGSSGYQGSGQNGSNQPSTPSNAPTNSPSDFGRAPSTGGGSSTWTGAPSGGDGTGNTSGGTSAGGNIIPTVDIATAPWGYLDVPDEFYIVFVDTEFSSVDPAQPTP